MRLLRTLNALSVICLFSLQLTAGTISGVVKSPDGEELPGVTVLLAHTQYGTTTDINGFFTLENLPPGSYTIQMHTLGYDQLQQQAKIARADQVIRQDFTLDQNDQSIREVTVLGLSDAEVVNRQAYNVTAIDAKKLYNSTLDLAHALDRVSGVRVREKGGVGSNIDFSLNGFSGNHVRFFLDGIPMDNFGSSFQINNIPINFAERVEVYKGVVPVWLGSDALGGAVNIVTGNKMRNYVDVSYAYGSFNTHRTNINAAITSKNGLTLQINAFQNYSDNDYKVTHDVADIYTGQFYRNKTVRRFHDRYHNETLIANVGFLDKSWADKLLIGITVGSNVKEIQTGARREAIFGAWHSRGNLLMPSLKYQKKDFILKGLDITLNANYNFGKELNVDTAHRRYGWLGDYQQHEGPGGERSRTMYKYGNNIGLVTATLAYQITERQSIALNNVFSTFNRKGYDLLFPEREDRRQPQQTEKNVTGLSYKYDINQKWTTTLFGKVLYQSSYTTLEHTPSGNWNDVIYIDQFNKTTTTGYGMATSYYFTPALQAKFSAEKSVRLPENEEMFGDIINMESNYDLKPESSHNFNLGLTYAFDVSEDHRFMIGATGIYRNAKDYIYAKIEKNGQKFVSDNLGRVRNIGGEFEARYSYKKFLMLDLNATYQDVRNMVKYVDDYTTINNVYMDRLFNLPFLFGHASASVFFDNVFAKGDKVSFGYNFLYVHAFYLYWPSQGDPEDKYDTEQQLAHDLNVVYALKDGRYNIAFECKNIMDARLFDNYSMQKPGRAFNIKLRYFYNR